MSLLDVNDATFPSDASIAQETENQLLLKEFLGKIASKQYEDAQNLVVRRKITNFSSFL
jgi:hypothetical protein